MTSGKEGVRIGGVFLDALVKYVYRFIDVVLSFEGDREKDVSQLRVIWTNEKQFLKFNQSL